VAVQERIICVGCPMGCSVILTIENNEVVSIEGNGCKQGEKYVLEEYRNPVRTFTTTLLTSGSSQPLLPVRTDKPIPRTEMLSASLALVGVRVKPPVRMGEVVVSRPGGIEADVIASGDLLE
jgi:CxxC motif-containing protein